MRRTHTHSPQTRDAAKVLGHVVARARREQQRTAAEVAERAGITRQTLRRVEQGDPTVAIGTVFEIATLLGVSLFGVDRRELAALVDRERDRLALLPDRVRERTGEVADDF